MLALCERYNVTFPPGEQWHSALTDAKQLALLWRAARPDPLILAGS